MEVGAEVNKVVGRGHCFRVYLFTICYFEV